MVTLPKENRQDFLDLRAALRSQSYPASAASGPGRCRPAYPCPKNSAMTAAVRAMSSSLCAAETKAASNCEAGQ